MLKAIDLADLQLKTVVGYETKLILVLLDADTDLPCELGPRLLAVAQSQRSHLNVSVVIANVEFETWFVGAASSLSAYFDLEAVNLSADPERARQGKATVLKLRRGRYGETVDQARFSAMMDLNQCRRNCPSFDKLCRELSRYLT